MDLILYNARIYSLESTRYDWMAIENGVIKALGYGNDYVELETCECIDLKGKTVLPGFYDTHVHLIQTGLNYKGVDLSGIQTIDQLLTCIREASETVAKGKLIRAFRFDITQLKERRFPTRRELDKVSPNHPVWINSIEFHMSALNTLALHKVNLPYTIDGIARDERNMPLGYFSGKASAFIRHRMFDLMDNDLRESGMMKAVELAISKGITSLHAMEGGFTFHEKDVSFLYDNRHQAPIDIKLFFQTFDFSKIEKYNLDCLGGDIFIDGSFGARTAAISKPYEGTNLNGKLYFNQDELNFYVSDAHHRGYQMALHAIGDRAIEQTLNAYENALTTNPRRDHRHRIEHFELATEDQIRRAKDMDLVISVQPTFEYFWGESGGMYEHRLGKELASRTNNFRRMIDEGLILCGGSDSDVNRMDPILGIHSAVNHPKKTSSITVLEAVEMFTRNAAFASFEEDVKGSLKVGKMADFVILDRDIFETDSNLIKDAKILFTYKEGNQIYAYETIRGSYE